MKLSRTQKKRLKETIVDSRSLGRERNIGFNNHRVTLHINRQWPIIQVLIVIEKDGKIKASIKEKLKFIATNDFLLRMIAKEIQQISI